MIEIWTRNRFSALLAEPRANTLNGIPSPQSSTNTVVQEYVKIPDAGLFACPLQTRPQSPPSLRRRPRHLHRPAGSCRFPWRRCLPAKRRLTWHACQYISSPKARTQGLDVGDRCKRHVFRQQDLCLDKGRGWLQHRTVSSQDPTHALPTATPPAKENETPSVSAGQKTMSSSLGRGNEAQKRRPR